jgi:uncharacterized membrane protein
MIPPLHRLPRSRPRLVATIAAGVATGIVLPSHWTAVSRVMTAWNVTVWCYLVLMAWTMMRAGHAKVREIARREDENAVAVLVIVCLACVLSIAAIVLVLGDAKALPPAERGLHYIFTAATLAGSWLMVGVIFTLHYAHMYYIAPEHHRPLHFPEEQSSPDYWDFLYFSFTIAVAAQTSDICIQTRPMRKAVLAQSVLSFFFNAAVLGLTINIAAGLIGT